MLSLFTRFAIISNFEKKKKQIDIDLIISIEQYIYTSMIRKSLFTIINFSPHTIFST